MMGWPQTLQTGFETCCLVSMIPNTLNSNVTNGFWKDSVEVYHMMNVFQAASWYKSSGIFLNFTANWLGVETVFALTGNNFGFDSWKKLSSYSLPDCLQLYTIDFLTEQCSLTVLQHTGSDFILRIILVLNSIVLNCTNYTWLCCKGTELLS